MCVEIKKGTRREQIIVCYKMFYTTLDNLQSGPKGLFSLCHHAGMRPYKVGELYTAKTKEGFQGFVNREDAEKVNTYPWKGAVCYKVILHSAAVGAVKNMSAATADRPGVTGKRMQIVKKMKPLTATS